MKERIANFLKYKGISQNDFAAKCGLKSSSISSFNLGIRSDKLADIGRTFPELSIDYLLGLSDEMIRGKSIDDEVIMLQQLLNEERINLAKCEMHIKVLQADKQKDNDNMVWMKEQLERKDQLIASLTRIIEKGEKGSISQSINA